MGLARRAKDFLLKVAAVLFCRYQPVSPAAETNHEPITGCQNSLCTPLQRPHVQANDPSGAAPNDAVSLPHYVLPEKPDHLSASGVYPAPANKALPAQLKIVTAQLFTLEFAVDGESKERTFYRAGKAIYGPGNIYRHPTERN